MRLMKTARLALIILSLSSLTTFAQSSLPTTSVKPAVVDVAMQFRGPTPAVEVMVNGQGPFVFTIDTGAEGMARIDSSLVEKLKLKVVDQRQAGDGSGNARALDVVQVDSISFGGVQFKDVRAITRNYNLSPSLPRIDGILGFNLFAEYLLTLDYPNGRVRLERGELPQANGAEIVSLVGNRAIPVIELRVGNHKINAHLDSGNTVGGFILPTALAEKMTFAGSPRVLGKARTVTSEVDVKEVRLKENIYLGRSEFKEPLIVYPAVSDDANVGSKILREFILTFDQKNKRVRLERHELPGTVEKTTPVATAPVLELKDYPGLYGERAITLEDGALFIQRPGGMKLKMSPVAKDEFSLERVPEARLKFVRSEKGSVTELHVLSRDGQWEKIPKQ